MNYYTVTRRRAKFFPNGEIDHIECMVIGAVGADSPMEAMAIALEWFPWKPHDNCSVRVAKTAVQIRAAEKWSRVRVQENLDFRRWLTTPAWEGECKGA